MIGRFGKLYMLIILNGRLKNSFIQEGLDFNKTSSQAGEGVGKTRSKTTIKLCLKKRPGLKRNRFQKSKD